MNTLQFYLDETARKHGREDFHGAYHISLKKELVDILKEAATLYAEEACKEQKRIDSDAARYIKIFSHISVNKDSILNAPLAVNTEKV